jgi:hypothetical protein
VRRETPLQIVDRFPSLALCRRRLRTGFPPSTLDDFELRGARHRLAGKPGALDTSPIFASHAILPSPDTRAEQPLGPAALFDELKRWPDRVVVMTLDRVGAGQGPVSRACAKTLEQAHGKKVIAAGGVRDAHDLEMLEAMGDAVLIASAIHDGTLDGCAGAYV